MRSRQVNTLPPSASKQYGFRGFQLSADPRAPTFIALVRQRIRGGGTDRGAAPVVAPADGQPLRYFSRRTLLHRLQPASGLGLRGHAAVHPSLNPAVYGAIRGLSV